MNRPFLPERPASRLLTMDPSRFAASARASVRLPSGQCPAGLPEIMGQNPPPDPATQPAFAMIEAALQPEPPPQETDPAFQPRPPAIARPEPPRLRFRRGFAEVRDREPFHPRRLGRFPVRRSRETPIRGGQLGRVPKLLLMPRQAFGQVLPVRVRLRQHRITADQAAFHFFQEQLAPELHLFARFAPRDDLRVRLEQAYDLVARRHLFPPQDPPPRLVHGLRQPR